MNIKTKTTSISFTEKPQSSVSAIAREYGAWQSLFEAQTEPVQEFLKAQARSLVTALLRPAPHAQFRLPKSVLVSTEETGETFLPREQVEQRLGRFTDRLTRTTLAAALKNRLDTLQASSHPGVPASAGLLRFAIATALVEDNLPSFRKAGNIILASVTEARDQLSYFQQELHALQVAVHLAPYIATAETYRRKQRALRDLLVKQGQALAILETRQIIATIQRRAANNNLNRGLSISLPYFDDQDQELKHRNFEIIPYGLFQFVPAFVVITIHAELDKVEQDAGIGRLPRVQLSNELRMLEEAFQPAGSQ